MKCWDLLTAMPSCLCTYYKPYDPSITTIILLKVLITFVCYVHLCTNKLHYGLLLFSLCLTFVGREKWTARWEDKIESRKGDTGAEGQNLEHASCKFHASSLPCSSSCCICCTKPSCSKQDNPIPWIPGYGNVAMDATFCGGHLWGS